MTADVLSPADLASVYAAVDAEAADPLERLLRTALDRYIAADPARPYVKLAGAGHSGLGIPIIIVGTRNTKDGGDNATVPPARSLQQADSFPGILYVSPGRTTNATREVDGVVYRVWLVTWEAGRTVRCWRRRAGEDDRTWGRAFRCDGATGKLIELPAGGPRP